MSKKESAVEVLPKYLTMIESDLMKVSHYLKDGVKVAIVAEDKELSEKLAEFYVQADELTKDFMKLTRRIVD
jgi:hypothetical protein